MVRICRQKLNYCVGASIEEPAVEILAAINSAIPDLLRPVAHHHRQVPHRGGGQGVGVPRGAAHGRHARLLHAAARRLPNCHQQHLGHARHEQHTRFSQANLGNEAFAQISALRYVVLGGVGGCGFKTYASSCVERVSVLMSKVRRRGALSQ